VKGDAIIEHGGIEISASHGTEGPCPHMVYPHFGDKPKEGLIGAHAVYPFFGDNSGGLIGEKMKGDAIIEHDGVEIIASSDTAGVHPHAVYPHFGDKPERDLLGAHAVYPKFDDSLGGLIGGEMKDDTIIEPGGIEIIASDGTEAPCPHVVYPHFGDKPEEGLLGAHAVYPLFADNSGGLIDEKGRDDAIIAHGGVEIIASDGTKGVYPPVVYPTFGDGLEEGLVGAHAVYPLLGESFESLIDKKVEDDAILAHDGIEIIASNGTEDACLHGVYPHFGDWPQGSMLGAHTVYPLFGDSSGGLICEEVNDTIIGNGGPDNSMKKPAGGIASRKSADPPESAGEGKMEGATFATTKAKDVHSPTTTSVGVVLPTGPRLPPDPPCLPDLLTGPGPPDPPCLPSSSMLELDEQGTLLVAALLALPRVQVLRVMQAVSKHVALKPGAPMQMCTGCGAPGEQYKLASNAWISVP